MWLRLAPAAFGLQVSGFEQTGSAVVLVEKAWTSGYKETDADQAVRNESKKKGARGWEGGGNKKAGQDKKGRERLLCSIGTMARELALQRDKAGRASEITAMQNWQGRSSIRDKRRCSNGDRDDQTIRRRSKKAWAGGQAGDERRWTGRKRGRSRGQEGKHHPIELT